MKHEIPYISLTGDGPLYPPTPFPWSGSWQIDMTTVSGHDGLAKGDPMYLFGHILDHKGKPIKGAMVEVWQADINGHYKHPRAQNQDELDPSFLYFASVKTREDGLYLFKTIVPKWYNFLGIFRAPHIHIKVKSNDHGVVTTEMQFAGKENDDLRKKDRVFQNNWDELQPRMVIPMEDTQKYADLGIDLDQNAVCYKHDLAFLY